MKEQLLVVCPGRGNYTSTELGYLRRFRPRLDAVLGAVDRARADRQLPTVTALDEAARYSNAVHGAPTQAAALVYTCAMADFASLDPERCEVVCVIGNSMGWYLALTAAGALEPDAGADSGQDAGIDLVDTMAELTGEGQLGGQIIYPLVDEAWHSDPVRDAVVRDAMTGTNAEDGARVFDSIHLGGYRVIAGNEAGLRSLASRLPPIDDRYPMRLVNHAPFHTPLMVEASRRAFARVPLSRFRAPRLPLVDGEGRIWQPYSTDVAALREYTLGVQVTHPYDFTRSVEVALREFAPSRVVLLGPGASLGGAIGQTLVAMRWRGLVDKTAFSALQARDPYLHSLGRPEQRSLVLDG
jgi:acyl transferase domain-containing protein